MAINHIWARHFHAPLVATVFGSVATEPNPPTPSFSTGWPSSHGIGLSMKHIHRLIVTSQAYRMARPGARRRSRGLDPENTFLWRMNPGRMEAEVVRDSLLACGVLDVTMEGKSRTPRP
ncbi:MAG: DUF1553 domain-containing protein [Singulisphaera sp.]